MSKTAPPAKTGFVAEPAAVRSRADARRARLAVCCLLRCVYGSITIENVHPVESGHFRRKLRRQRRHGVKLENPLTFYPRRIWRQTANFVAWYRLYRGLKTLADRIEADPAKLDYTDLALTPTTEAEAEGLEMLKVHGDAANALQRANLGAESGEPKRIVAAE